jgi:tRNA1Val (adenine37-N6)-methyltransferase
LADGGIFSILIPFYREEEALILAKEQNLFCQKLIRVKQTPSHNFFRSILFFSRQPMEKEEEEILIRLENKEYSPEFQVLLRPFYLNL